MSQRGGKPEGAPPAANLSWPLTLSGAGKSREATWDIAEECPVGIRFNGAMFAVMLASPNDLEDFALGFALSEGVIDAPNELQDIKVKPLQGGIELSLTIAGKRAVRLEASERRRALAGGSGCGLCGVQGFEEFTTPLPEVPAGTPVTRSAIMRTAADFPNHQTINRLNRSVHGSAFADAEGNILLVREDVGRHNALDKLIGAVMAAGHDPAGGILFLSSRAGYELVHKAARMGFPLMVSISAPTAMAIRAAEAAGITLASLAGEDLAVFTQPMRILLD